MNNYLLVDEVENNCELVIFLPDFTGLCGGLLANYVVFALYHF